MVIVASMPGLSSHWPFSWRLTTSASSRYSPPASTSGLTNVTLPLNFAVLPRASSTSIVTARASSFPAGVRKLGVSTLDESAAAQFLLDRTEADRAKSKDDAALARTLARELGGLALGLEQAGAQIATQGIGFARYLKLWNESRERALAWADATVTGSDRTLATTWATSVAQLTELTEKMARASAFRASPLFKPVCARRRKSRSSSQRSM